MIQEKKKQRFQFLEKLYESTNGSSSGIVMMYELGQELNFDRNTTSNVVEYLTGELLIEPRTLGGGISITHNGILEIEAALENPNRPTQHFPAINIINIENMNGSSIQQGTVNSTQIMEFKSEKIPTLKELIQHLENVKHEIKISNQAKQEFIAEIETLKSQSNSPKPKHLIITESLKTVRNLIEGTAAGAMTPMIIQLIQDLVG